MKLGWTERNERCLAWQFTATPDHPERGWCCFQFAKLSNLELEESWEGVPEPADQGRPPQCVVVPDGVHERPTAPAAPPGAMRGKPESVDPHSRFQV